MTVTQDGSVIRHAATRKRSRQRIQAISEYATERGLTLALVCRADVRAAFGDAGKTKQAIAVALAAEFPELEARLPRPRKPWMAEDERMNIFDALSFVLASLHWASGVAA